MRRSILVIAVLIAATLGMLLLMMARAGQTPIPAAGAFPADWFDVALDDERAAQALLIGKPMPPMDLSDWKPAAPADWKGKILVVDFWATWCAPCIASFPDNSELQSKYQDRGVQFIGICTNTLQEKYGKIIAEKQPKYAMARDADQKTMNAWAAQTYPLYALVDRSGMIRAMGLKHEYLAPAIEKLLAEPMPTTAP